MKDRFLPRGYVFDRYPENSDYHERRLAKHVLTSTRVGTLDELRHLRGLTGACEDCGARTVKFGEAHRYHCPHAPTKPTPPPEEW